MINEKLIKYGEKQYKLSIFYIKQKINSQN